MQIILLFILIDAISIESNNYYDVTNKTNK